MHSSQFGKGFFIFLIATRRLPTYSGRVVGCCIGLSSVPDGSGLRQSARQTVPNEPSPTSLMSVKSRGPSRISDAAVVGICALGGGARLDVLVSGVALEACIDDEGAEALLDVGAGVGSPLCCWRIDTPGDESADGAASGGMRGERDELAYLAASAPPDAADAACGGDAIIAGSGEMPPRISWSAMAGPGEMRAW